MKILAISLVSDHVSTQVQKKRRARIPVAMQAVRVVVLREAASCCVMQVLRAGKTYGLLEYFDR